MVRHSSDGASVTRVQIQLYRSVRRFARTRTTPHHTVGEGVRADGPDALGDLSLTIVTLG
jgi:hypothetical protein